MIYHIFEFNSENKKTQKLLGWDFYARIIILKVSKNNIYTLIGLYAAIKKLSKLIKEGAKSPIRYVIISLLSDFHPPSNTLPLPFKHHIYTYQIYVFEAPWPIRGI